MARTARYTGRHPRGTATRPLPLVARDVATWAALAVLVVGVLALDWTAF